MLPQHPKFLFYSILTGLFGCVLSGCGPSAGDALPPEDDLYAYSLAVAEKVRLEVPPERYLPVFHIGKVHQRFGLEEKALELFRAAIELQPNAPEPCREIGFLLSQRKERMNEALDAYQQSLLGDPTQKGIYTRIAMIYIHQGRLEEALRALEQELKQEGASELTYYELGHVHQLQNQHAEAIEYYDKVPEMREALYGKYKSLQALGRKEEATATLKKFRKIKDASAEAEKEADRKAKKSNRDEQLRFTAKTWDDAAIVFIQEHNREQDAEKRERYLEEAVQAMHEALRFNKHIRGLYDVLVRHYGERGMFQQSSSVLEQGLDAFPDDPVLMYELASLHLHLASKDAAAPSRAQRAEEAILHLEKALEVAPEFAEAHFLLAKAILFYKRQSRELVLKALEHATKALELDKKPEAEHYDILAMALHFAGRREVARKTLRDGLSRFPDAPSLRQRLARYEESLR